MQDQWRRHVNAVRAVPALLIFLLFAALPDKLSIAADQSAPLDVKSAICIVLDDLYADRKKVFPKNFEIKVDEREDQYIVHVIPLPTSVITKGMEYDILGGDYKIIVDKKTRRTTERYIGQ